MMTLESLNYEAIGLLRMVEHSQTGTTCEVNKVKQRKKVSRQTAQPHNLSTMARTKQTAKKTTGAPSVRMDLNQPEQTTTTKTWLVLKLPASLPAAEELDADSKIEKNDEVGF